MTFFGAKLRSGSPLTTAPSGSSNRSWDAIQDASIQSTRALGNRVCSNRMKSEPYSISVRSLSLTPRDNNASVKTPVPGPSSRTGPEAGVISLVIRLARFAPEGAIAPTLRGLNAKARKNNKTLCAAIGVSHPSDQTASSADVGMGAGMRDARCGNIALQLQPQKISDAKRSANRRCGDGVYEARSTGLNVILTQAPPAGLSDMATCPPCRRTIS